MLTWFINCCAVCLMCILLAGIVIPQILLIAFRKQLFDIPDERKIHKSLVPRLGGIAFKPVIFFSIAFLLGLNLFLESPDILTEATRESEALAFGFCTVMILYLVGLADDLIGIRYSAKFIVQIICGVMLIMGGVSICNLYGIFFLESLPVWFGYPLTILIVVFIINAINLIDGIDGLASGLCGIACLSYGLTFFALHQYFYAMVSFATLGVLIPFFYYNVFGDAQKRQKIFMGDTGSLTIGMILCFLSIKMLLVPNPQHIGDVNPIILAFSPLFVPCCDVVRVYLHRVRNGKNPFLPDKNHIHHKLLAIGLKQRIAMVSIIAFSLILTITNVLLSSFMNVNWIFLIDLSVWIFVNIWLSKRIISINNKQ